MSDSNEFDILVLKIIKYKAHWVIEMLEDTKTINILFKKIYVPVLQTNYKINNKLISIKIENRHPFFYSKKVTIHTTSRIN